MKSDQALKQDVEQELLWDPAIDARQIRVTVHDRIVTLVGAVASYAQKLAAQKATQRVTGCRALVIELNVPESSPPSHSDEDLATAILSARYVDPKNIATLKNALRRAGLPDG